MEKARKFQRRDDKRLFSKETTARSSSDIFRDSFSLLLSCFSHRQQKTVLSSSVSSQTYLENSLEASSSTSFCPSSRSASTTSTYPIFSDGYHWFLSCFSATALLHPVPVGTTARIAPSLEMTDLSISSGSSSHLHEQKEKVS